MPPSEEFSTILDQPAPVSTPVLRASSAEAEEEISLLDLLILIFRNKRFLLKVTGGAALGGIALALLWPIRYKATTSILPPQQGSSVGMALMAQLGSLGSVASGLGALKNPNDLQVAILKSQTIEDAMVDRFHLMQLYHRKKLSDARKALESYVDIDPGTKDGLIRISITDSSARRAAEMANAYVDIYKKRTADLAVTEASQRRVFFGQQMLEAKNNLANAEEALKKTEQQTGMVQLDSQARAVIELVAQLRAQISAKEVQIQAMRSFATGENPDLQIAEQQLAGLQSQLTKMGAKASTNGLPTDLGIPKASLQQAGLEYVRRLRDVKYYETIFDLIARQYEIAKVDEARHGALVQVVDPAIVPDRRSSPHRTLIVLGCTIFGFMGGIFWVLIQDRISRLSQDPAEKERLETLRGLVFRQKVRKIPE